MANPIHMPTGRALAVPALGVAAAIPLIILLLIVPQLVAAQLAPAPSAPVVSGGGSVHVKNGVTPDWMIELMTKQARQRLPAARGEGHGYWI